MLVWELAHNHGCVLAAKDDDFHRLSVLGGAPPLVAWLRLGNCTTDDVVQLLRERRADNQAIGQQDEATILALG